MPSRGTSHGPRSTADLPDDLRELVANVHDRAARIRVAEAEHVYALAALAQAAVGRHLAGGLTAMKVCAIEVGVSRPTLQSYSALATRWTSHDLHALLERRDVHGRTLSLSQLRLLALLPSDARNEGLECAFAQGLDVRSLKETLRGRVEAGTAKRTR